MVYVFTVSRALQRPRVLTEALSAAAAERGFDLVALDPSNTAQWKSRSVNIIIHKLPEDPGVSAALNGVKVTPNTLPH